MALVWGASQGLPARIQRCTVPPANPDNPADPQTPASPATPANGGAGDSEAPPLPPDLSSPPRLWPGLDRLAVLQATGGLAVGLIALFSSYDHLTLAGYRLALQQQWGIPCIVASVAIIVIDAQLATRARDRATYEADRAAYEADRERNRAAEERERQAERAERQRQSLAELRRSALLSARFHLDPSPANRRRWQAFLALITPQLDPQDDG